MRSLTASRARHGIPRPDAAAESSEASKTRRSPPPYLVLVFALSIPFALLGWSTGVQLFPGIPMSALGFVCPVSAALILAYREDGSLGARALLRRAIDYRRVRDRRWFLPILLLAPCIALVTYAIGRAMDSPLPSPRFPLPGALVNPPSGSRGGVSTWSAHA